MKRLNIKKADGKTVFSAPAYLMQAGLVLVFALCGLEKAAAQTAVSPAMPAVSIDAAPSPSSATPAAAPASAASAAPKDISVPPASAAAQQTPPVAAKTVTTQTTVQTVTTPAAPVQAAPVQTTPVQTGAAAPSPAELAIVKSAAKMNGIPPATPAARGRSKEDGLRVTDILTTPANVRPLPKDYLVVKKDHGANEADSRLTAARLALGQGHYQSALELFDDLYRKNPRDMRVAMGRAVALQKLGQTDEALDAYQAALRTDPHNIEALTNMLGLLKGKNAPIAIKKLQELRDMYPANADVTAQLGMVYGQSGDYEKALKYLNMADALKPGNATVLYNKAVAYDRMGRTAEAATLYRQIVLLASDGSLDESFPLEVVRQRLATIR